MNLPEFHNNLLISSIFPFKTEKYSIISPSTRRHRFLNGLALLLNGSNQCTSVYPWLKKNKLLIARNESLTNDDEIYFNRFFGLIRIFSNFCLTSNQEGMDETYSILKSIIFQYNKEKCIKRILDPLFNDAILNLENLSNSDIDKICENITIDKYVSKKGSADYIYLKKKHMPLKEYISILFTWINDILLHRDSIGKNKNNSQLKTIEDLQGNCELLYYSEVFRDIISNIYSIVYDSDRIIYYLDKVSAHKRSLDLILACLEQRTLDYGEIYKKIQWYFIEPMENIIELKEAPSASFDKIWLECGLTDDQTKIDFKLKHIGNKFIEYDSSLKLSTCLHSEIQIIDYLIEHNIHEVYDNDIEIGISKLPCYPCSLYIEKLNIKFNRNFCVASLTTHGKIYSKWTFRNNEDNIIKDYVNDQLYTLIKKELQNIQRNQRKKSGDNDKQQTDVDDDDIYDKYVNRTININTKHQ